MGSCTLGNVHKVCFLPFKLGRAEATGPLGHMERQLPFSAFPHLLSPSFALPSFFW